jgi:hypothetical protein
LGGLKAIPFLGTYSPAAAALATRSDDWYSLYCCQILKILKKQFHVIHCIQKKKEKKTKKRTLLAFRCCERKRTTVFLGTREFFVHAVESVISLEALLASKAGDVKWRKLGNSGSNKEV